MIRIILNIYNLSIKELKTLFYDKVMVWMFSVGWPKLIRTKMWWLTVTESLRLIKSF